MCANGSFRNVSVGEQHGIVAVFLTVSFFKRDTVKIIYRKKIRSKILKDKERKKRTKILKEIKNSPYFKRNGQKYLENTLKTAIWLTYIT